MNQAASPKVSIIVPVYNVEKYIRRCLDSLAAQSFHDFECILVDDCSTDSSGKICGEYESKDSRFRVVHKQSNGGLPQARNSGLAISSGRYILFVDSDDYTEHDMIEKMHSKAIEEDFDMVCCDFYNNRDDGYSYGVQTFDFENNFNNLGFVHCCAVWNKLWKREILQKVKFPQGSRYEDRVITQQALFYCGKIAKVEYPLYHYCLNPVSISNDPSRRLKGYYEWQNNIVMVIDFLKEKLERADFEKKKPGIAAYVNHFMDVIRSDKSVRGFRYCPETGKWSQRAAASAKRIMKALMPHGILCFLRNRKRSHKHNITGSSL